MFASVIEKFKKSKDYRDISYFIDHVSDITIRLSCLEELNYYIGVDITTNSDVKNITIGKKNEIRMQVTPKFKNVNLSRCVIIKQEDIYE